MNYYVGIDPSLTATGVVVIDKAGDIVDQSLITTKPKDDMLVRYHIIIDNIFNAMQGSKYPVYIEGPSLHSKGRAVAQMFGLYWVIRWELNKANIPCEAVPPTQLKKFVTTKGNAKKEQMLLHTFKRWGIEFADNNLCDAYCLARWGLANG